jgi:transposase
VERAFKKAILHRRNSIFFKTQRGARVRDLFMKPDLYVSAFPGQSISLSDRFLHRNADRLVLESAQWMPWNYHETLCGSHARSGAQLTWLAVTHACRKDTIIQLSRLSIPTSG